MYQYQHLKKIWISNLNIKAYISCIWKTRRWFKQWGLFAPNHEAVYICKTICYWHSRRFLVMSYVFGSQLYYDLVILLILFHYYLYLGSLSRRGTSLHTRLLTQVKVLRYKFTVKNNEVLLRNIDSPWIYIFKQSYKGRQYISTKNLTYNKYISIIIGNGNLNRHFVVSRSKYAIKSKRKHMLITFNRQFYNNTNKKSQNRTLL